MSRKLPLAVSAAVLAGALGLAGASQAWPFGKKEAAKPAATAAATADAKAHAAAPSPPRKATAVERAQAERLEPVSRAAFWARETDVDPNDTEAGLKLSQSLRALTRYDEAAAAADHVLVTHPDNAEAMLELARSHIARGQAFFAVAPLQKAASLAPRDWRPQSLLGVAYEQISRPDEAKAAWAKALSLSPDNPAVLSNMAMASVSAGDAAQAETLLRKAVTQPSATLQTRQNLALVLGLQGKTVEAERIIRTNLPPELAEQDLAWIKARAAGGPAAAAPKRTWNSVQGSEGGG